MKHSQKEYNKTYLAQWLSGDISDSEIQNILSEEDFRAYSKIREKTELFESPEFDTQTVKKNIDKKISDEKKGDNPYSYKWFYAAAAMLALILSVYFYDSNKNINYSTLIKEKQEFNLPDGSVVKINSNSNLSFSKNLWKKERVVNLSGEAFFKVKKGKKFSVQTSNGLVSVFGTEFNINSQYNFFNVKCFSGRVRVIHQLDTLFLVKGQAFQYNGQHKELWEFKTDKPAWINNESIFKSTPLKIVISSLEDHFDIKIISKEIDDNQIFTGSYSYDNLEIALKSVFYPMGIKYQIDNKTVFLSKK